jgi:hypothetical protein
MLTVPTCVDGEKTVGPFVDWANTPVGKAIMTQALSARVRCGMGRWVEGVGRS